MEFNLGKLEEIFYNIQDIIEYFEQIKCDKNKNIIFLGNGERLNLQIPKECIAHLLGINTNYLTSLGYFKNTNSYYLLKELSENAYTINNMHNKGIIDYDKLFSPFVEEKIKSFKDNIKINIFETELVVKYNIERTYGVTERQEKCDYIIVKKSNNNWNVLQLIKNTYSSSFDYFIPMSNQVFEDYGEMIEYLKPVVKNQEITLLSGVLLKNDYSQKNYTLTVDNFITKIKNIQKYKEIFDCSIDVNNIFEFSLNETKKHTSIIWETKNLITQIVEYINKGKIIDIDVPKDSDLTTLIDAFNNFIYSKNSSNTEELSYTILKAELDELRKKTITLQSQIDSLLVANETLRDENETLKSENDDFKDTNEKILTLLTKK